MAANLPRSRSVGPVRFIRTEGGLGISAGVGRVRINRTPSGLITRTVHRPGTVVDTTTVLNSRRHAVASGLEGDPPETRRAAAERRRAAAATDAEDGGGATRDVRNGCVGCGGLLFLVVLMIVGLASCLGGSGVLPFTDSPSRTMLPTAVSSPHGSGDPNASATDASSSRSALPPGMTNVPSPSSLVTTTSATRFSSPTSPPRPRSSRPAPKSVTSAAPTRHVPRPTARPTTEPTRNPPRRPSPSPTRNGPRPTFCYPTTEAGGCYHAGDYCWEAYYGLSGVDAYGRRITCMPLDDFGIWM